MQRTGFRYECAMYKRRLHACSRISHSRGPSWRPQQGKCAAAHTAILRNYRSNQTWHNDSASEKPQTRVVFSGIQPTGIPHLGNYAGALRQWVQLQHREPADTKLMYSIVDLHAMTTPQNPETLKRCKRETLATLLAIGIDPERSTLFYQSSVSRCPSAAG